MSASGVAAGYFQSMNAKDPQWAKSGRLAEAAEKKWQSFQKRGIEQPRADGASEGELMDKKIAAWALISCLTLQDCSSRPRQFTPTLASPTSSQADFEAALATCHQLLAAGKLNSSGRTGSLAGGAGAGAGTAAVGGTAAAMAGGWGGVALASATVVLLPFAVVGGAWGMSRMKRAKKERAIKTALEGCLQERGFHVAGWSKTIGKPVVVQPAPTSARAAASR